MPQTSVACRAYQQIASHAPHCYSILRAAKAVERMTFINKAERSGDVAICHRSCLLLTVCFGLKPMQDTQPRSSFLQRVSGMGLCSLISFPCGMEQCVFLVFPSSHSPRRGFSSPLVAESRRSHSLPWHQDLAPAAAACSLLCLPSTRIMYMQWCTGLSTLWRAAGGEGAAGRERRLVGRVEGGVKEESKTGRGYKERWDGNGRKAAGGRGESGKWIEMS